MTDTDPKALLMLKLAEARAARRTIPRHAPTFRVDAPPGTVVCRLCAQYVTADELFDQSCPGEQPK